MFKTQINGFKFFKSTIYKFICKQTNIDTRFRLITDKWSHILLDKWSHILLDHLLDKWSHILRNFTETAVSVGNFSSVLDM